MKKTGYGNKWRWHQYAQYFFNQADLSLSYFFLSKKEKSVFGKQHFLRPFFYQSSSFTIPIYFNIQHGLELFLKGFLRKKYNVKSKDFTHEKKGLGHNLDKIYRRLLKNSSQDKILHKKIQALEQYVDFYKISIDKYPEDTKGHLSTSAKSLQKISTFKNIKKLRDDLIEIYKRCNQIGAYIDSQKKNPVRTKP